MAEFSEVMRQWSRMCGAMLGQEGKCEDCGLWKTYRVCGGVPSAATSEDFAEVERVVMAWAAEHPEPVYPTWIDWLRDVGVIPTQEEASRSMRDGVRAASFYVTTKAFSQIPTDMAKRLEIKPKEV